MVTDHRLQIHLSDSNYKSLKERADEEGRSLAAVAREAIAAYVAKSEKERIQEGHRRIAELVGTGRGPRDGVSGSDDHDRIVEEFVEEEYLRKTGQRPKK